MRKGTLAGAFGCLGIILILAVAVVVWAILAAPVKTPVLGNLRFSCTLGATQTRTSVTIRGPLSGRECRRLLDQTNRLPVHLEQVA